MLKLRLLLFVVLFYASFYHIESIDCIGCERRLQFDTLSSEASKSFKRAGFDSLFIPPKQRGNEEFLHLRKSGSSGKKKRTAQDSSPISPEVKAANIQNKLKKVADRILIESDKYNQWWTGPGEEFTAAAWSTPHNHSHNAIFSVAMQHGKMDIPHLNSPRDLILFLGSARKIFSGDIVLAIDPKNMNDIIRRILTHYKVTVYLLPLDLCGKDQQHIYCGPIEERVPLSVFRYFFYEKWAVHYRSESLILVTDYQDIYFQEDPFGFHAQDWLENYQLLLFQEFFPKMILQRSIYHVQVLTECYGENILQEFGNRNVISTGSQLGTRDGIVLWSHAMTKVSTFSFFSLHQ